MDRKSFNFLLIYGCILVFMDVNFRYIGNIGFLVIFVCLILLILEVSFLESVLMLNFFIGMILSVFM